jgi:hypothetical protein
MWKWKKQKNTPLNKQVVNLALSINFDELVRTINTSNTPHFRGQSSALKEVTKTSGSKLVFTEIHQLSLIPSGNGFCVYHFNQTNGTGFFNDLPARIDFSDFIYDDSKIENSKNHWVMELALWNANLILSIDDFPQLGLIAPCAELDNLMLLGKTNFHSDNAIIDTKENKLSVPSAFKDGKPTQYTEINSTLSAHSVEYHNKLFRITAYIPNAAFVRASAE